MKGKLFSLLDICIACLYVFLPFLLAFFSLKKSDDKRQKNDTILLYYLVISIGIQGINSGLWQVFKPSLVAEILQWPANPFLLELGLANIAFGILGLLCPWMDRGWRMASAVGYGTFLLLTGILHVMRILQYGISHGDAGGFLFSDIMVPLILFALISTSKHSNQD